MHAPTRAHTERKLSVSETTHSAALTPRLGAHTTVPLACQGWKLYTHVIPAALRMVGNKACRNKRETESEGEREKLNLSPHGLQ